MPLSKITNPTLSSSNNKISSTGNNYIYTAGSSANNEYMRIASYWDSVANKQTARLGLNTNDPNRAIHIKGLGSTGSSEMTFEQAPLNGSTAIVANGKFWNIVVDGGDGSTNSNFAIRRLNDDGNGNTSAGLIISGSTGIVSTPVNRKISPASVPAGSIIQVVQHSLYSIGLFSSSGNASELDVTNSTRTFTPQYSNSKVLHIITIGLKFVCDGRIWIRRDGSNVSPSLGDQWREMNWDATVDMGPTTMHWIDSPGTTSSISYSLRVQASGCGSVIAVGHPSDFTPYWTMMEIAA